MLRVEGGVGALSVKLKDERLEVRQATQLRDGFTERAPTPLTTCKILVK